MLDIVSQADPAGWLVVGWFTPDYRERAASLAVSLDAVSTPYHLKAVDKVGSGWASETMRKPQIVADFMALYPETTLVLLDADCTVAGSLIPLVRCVRGDVAAYLAAKSSGRGKDRARVKAMSGTMVFRPTSGAARFVSAWRAAIGECDATDVDQTALMIALGRETGFTFEPLDAKWCSYGAGITPQSVIIHDNAGREGRRRLLRWPFSVA